MSRSLKIKSKYLDNVKLALRRNGFPSQRSLAEDVGLALATVSNFLTGKAVDFATFEELCRRLALDWREIADLETPKTPSTPTPPRAPLYPNGAVPLHSPFYLERNPVTEQIQQEIQKPGSLVRIKAPREMGKTSLLLRIITQARNLGYQTILLNLEQAEAEVFNSLKEFLRWFCANCARQISLPAKLDEYWDEDLGSKMSCSSYFEDYLLPKVDTPLLLALDEACQIFAHPHVAKDFLALLRSWYESAKISPLWQKLRLIIVHSTEIYIPLQLNQSPFNVGLPVQLNYFSLAEVQKLAQIYGLDWSTQAAEQLLSLVGGHPALVHIAIYHLNLQQSTPEQILTNLCTPSSIFFPHLQRQRLVLEQHQELFQATQLVINSVEPVQLEPLLAHKLSSLGIIKYLGSQAVPSCELYRQYFQGCS